MAAYPAIDQTYETREEIADGLAADVASNGKPRVRVLFSGERRRFEVAHMLVTGSEKDTLLAFYSANKGLEFTFTSAADGVARTCVFAGAPRVRARRGGFWDVTMLVAER